MQQLKWLNLEAYGATLEYWRNKERKFFFVALGGTPEAQEAFAKLGGTRALFFKEAVAFHFPPMEGAADSARWLAALPKAAFEQRPLDQVFMVKADAAGVFPEAMKIAAIARSKSWVQKAFDLQARQEAEAVARASADADDDIDILGFDDSDVSAESVPAVVQNVEQVAVPVVATPAVEAPVSSQAVEPPVAAAEPEVQAEPAEPAEPPRSVLETFIYRLHEGDDRPVIVRAFREMPEEAELAEIEASESSGAVLMATQAGVFDLVLSRMPEDLQAAMILIGNSRDRMISNVNRMLAANPSIPLVAATWGSSHAGTFRLVLLADGTLPRERRLASLRGAELGTVVDETEMGAFVNQLWREAYGQEDEIFSAPAGVQIAGNAAQPGVDSDRGRAPVVSGASDLAPVEGPDAARSGIADGAGAAGRGDSAVGAGRDGGAGADGVGAELPAGGVGNAGDVRGGAVQSGRSGGDADGDDRGVPERGDEPGLASGLADRGRRGDRAPGAGAGRRAAVDLGAGGAGSAPAGAPGGLTADQDAAPVADAEVPDAQVAATDLTEAQTGRVRDEMEARRRERRSGMSLDMEENSGRLPYVSRSALTNQGTMVPANMATAIQYALDRLEERHGRLDEFVSRQLGFASPADMEGRLFAEQVDAVALTLDSFGRGSDMVLGDLTGIGKGRVLAALIRFAHMNDMPVVFVTKDQTLYNSMARELAVLGMSELVDRRRMLITTTGVGLENDQGEQLFPGWNAEQMNEIYASRQLPQGVRMIFTCHSQLMIDSDAERIQWLKEIAPEALLLVDESHLSAGVDSLCGQNLRALASASRHTLYSSATSAKEGKNLSLYSGTDLRFLGKDGRLVETLKKGGAAAMEAVPMMLAMEGQYIRREHDLSRAQYRAPDVPEDLAPVIRRNMDAISAALRALLDLQQVVSGRAIDLNGHDYFVRRRDQVEDRRNARERFGLSSMHFSSTLHHFTQQALLSVHADFFADLMIDSLREGNKPVLVLQSTMETVLAEMSRLLSENDVNPDGATVEVSFGSLLRRLARRITDVQLAAGNGVHAFNLMDPTVDLAGRSLPRQLQLIIAGWHVEAHQSVGRVMAEFNAAVERIPAGIPVSPIDHMAERLAAAGFSSGELTGRKWHLRSNGEGRFTLQRRSGSSKRDRQLVINRFNSGDSDALIINKAGATGIDLHADLRFADQRPRDMIIAQADDDIYVFQQSLGRVFRANMAVAPRYTLPGSAVPVAVRGMALMRRRLSSMMSLTRGSRDSEVAAGGMPDIFNWVGCEAAVTYLQHNREVCQALEINLAEEARKIAEHGGDTGLANRVTALAILLPCDLQDELMDGLIRAYENKLEDLEQQGVNPFRSRHLDIKAEVVNEVVLQPATGPSVFQGPVMLRELRFMENLPPLSSDTIRTLVTMARRDLSLEGGSSRNWSRFPLLEVMPEITRRMNDRMLNMRDLFNPDGGETSILDAANNPRESFSRHAARDYLCMDNFAGRLKLGMHLHIRLDSDVPANFHVVGIETPTSASMLGDPYEWRLRMVSVDAHARQTRVPLRLLFTEALRVQKDAFDAVNDEGAQANTAVFAVDWTNLVNGVSDPEQDMINDQGRFVDGILSRYENLPLGQVEVRRHVLSGNILRAIEMASEMHKGLPATYTMADGSRDYGVVMPNNFDSVRLLYAPVKFQSVDLANQYLVHRLSTQSIVTMPMSLTSASVPGLTQKDVAKAEKDRFCEFYLEARRNNRSNTVNYVLSVPRAKGRSAWLVGDERVAEITQGMEWSRTGASMMLSFSGDTQGMPERLKDVVARLFEIGVPLRSPSIDNRAREWMVTSARQLAATVDQQFDAEPEVV